MVYPQPMEEPAACRLSEGLTALDLSPAVFMRPHPARSMGNGGNALEIKSTSPAYPQYLPRL